MSPDLQTQKEGATEVGTLSPVTHSSVSTSGDTTESSAPRDSLEVRVRRFLDGLRARNAAESPLDRYRRAQDEGTEELCRRGCGQPAFYNSECTSCSREEWPTC